MNDNASDPKAEKIESSGPFRSWYLDEHGDVQFRVELKDVNNVTIFDDVAEIVPTATRQ